MTNIYDQHKASFPLVSAYVIVKDNERVATIAFKFPRDGAGRLCAYVHWLGVPMVRGFASGYGYDKRSAAVANAIGKMECRTGDADVQDNRALQTLHFMPALETDGGEYWDRKLENAGFTVWQAV